MQMDSVSANYAVNRLPSARPDEAIQNKSNLAETRNRSFERTDACQVSDTVMKAYQGDDPQANKTSDFEDRFKDALMMFTEFGKQLNGVMGKATGQEAYLALQVLADKSGLELPGNLSANMDESLAAIRDAWGLDENSSTGDIFDAMVRVFGGDTSFGPPDSSTNGSEILGPEGPPPPIQPEDVASLNPKDEMAPPVGTPPPDVATEVSEDGDETETLLAEMNDNLREALGQLTNRLFLDRGVAREPNPGDHQRVLDLISERLGIEGEVTSESLLDALGLTADASVSDILSEMNRVLGEDWEG